MAPGGTPSAFQTLRKAYGIVYYSNGKFSLLVLARCHPAGRPKGRWDVSVENAREDGWEACVGSYLAAHPKVALAYLFGSFAKGRSRPDSDVDVAVYFAAPYSEHDVKTLWSGIEDIVHRDVDLIVLNSAPPGISWTAMKGKVLVDKDPRLHVELMLDKSREAEDFREFIVAILNDRRRRWGDEHAQPIS